MTVGLLMLGSQHGITTAINATGPNPRHSAAQVDDDAYTAAVHFGTCTALDPSPAFRLGDIPLITTDIATPAPDQGMAVPKETVSSANIPVPLDRLITESTAITVRLRSVETERPIACGEITGLVHPHIHALSPGGLMIPLREMHKSGYDGVAWLQPCVGNTTSVTIFLGPPAVENGPTTGPGTEMPMTTRDHANGKPILPCH